MQIPEQTAAGQFRKKPVVISATQWHRPGDHPAVRAISPTDDLYFTGMGGASLANRESYGVIGTLESPAHLVTPGDWIITGVQGEHYPCKPDIFAATYEPAALATTKATAPVAADLHGAIMNIQHNKDTMGPMSSNERLGYRLGHRDARHAAAELIAAGAPVEAIGEPVARVDSFTNGSYSRNYKVTWLRNVPEGTMLYARPAAAEAATPATPSSQDAPRAVPAGLSDAQNAERYRWLRRQNWHDSDVCVVVSPKTAVRLGSFCPHGLLLDQRIDAALAASAPGATDKVGNE